MHRSLRRLVWVGMLVAPLAVAGRVEAGPKATDEAKPAGSQARCAADYVPKGVLIAAVLRDGDRHVDEFRALLDRKAFFDSDLGRRLLIHPELTPARLMLGGLATAAQSDAWSSLAAMFGQDLAIGVALRKGGDPRVILAVVARDPALLDRLLACVHAMTGLVVDGEPDTDRSRVVSGVRVFAAGGDLYHCRVDDALILSNSKKLMRASLKAAKQGKGSLATSKRFRRAEQEIPKEAAAWAVVDVARLRETLGEQDRLPQQMDDALACFAIGGWWHAIRQTDEALLWVTTAPDSLRIEARVAVPKSLPDSHRGFAPGETVASTWKPADLPRFLADVHVSRAWADLFAERETLMTLPAASDLVNFATTVSNLFGGLDFTEDVLPSLGSGARFIAARQDFSESEVIPSPQLPAFALVLPLRAKKTPSFERRLYSATQMAITFLSLDQAEQGQPAYLMDTARHRGHRMVFSAYDDNADASAMNMDPSSSKPAERSEEDEASETSKRPRRADIRRNFLPAAAVVDGQYVVATSRDLLQDIIDAIADGKPAKAKGKETARHAVADGIHLDVQSLVRILAANRNELITNRMLDEDQPKGLATRDINGFLAVLSLADRVSLWSNRGQENWRAGIEITLRGSGDASAGDKRP